MRKSVDYSEKPVNWNNIALKLIPVMILMIMGIMYLFNANSDKVYIAYYNITNETNPYEDMGSGDIGPVFLPHHILLILITIGIMVVIAFAVYILNSINEEESPQETYIYSDF
ncbi:MAG: hypothetical protein DRN71_03430 [Candidatus Nanohalarchaeota archaeon]|nr:MAG: hypothetical protein DRN71_03430 [Candidatus Nanohaloarchaeota archaeon]